MTPGRERKLRQITSELRKAHAALGKKFLELAAHPDATANQIMAAREMYLRSASDIRAMNHQLRTEHKLRVRKFGIPDWIQI